MIYYQYHLGGTAMQFLAELGGNYFLYAIINVHVPLAGQIHDNLQILEFPKSYIEKQTQEEGEKKLVVLDNDFPYNKRLIIQIILSKRLEK